MQMQIGDVTPKGRQVSRLEGTRADLELHYESRWDGELMRRSNGKAE